METARETLNVKKYRAATTREALEKIKQELGEDALVLETKQIRTGGFLGFGHGTMIEMSAARSMAASGNARTSIGMLELAENSSASPSNSFDGPSFAQVEPNPLPAFLKAFTEQKIASVRPRSLGTALPRLKPVNIDAVEVSSEAPRIVHPKKDRSASTPVARLAEPEAAAPTVSREIELLRAELREMKFSLGSMMNRRTAADDGRGFDVEAFTGSLESPYFEAFMELTERGMSPESVRDLLNDRKCGSHAGELNSGSFTRELLKEYITDNVRFEDPCGSDGPQTIAIIGATGVGKTTTIAKLAARKALYEKKPVELVTLDTYRIAAVEQLKTYAEIIGARCHVVQSIFELDATLRRLPADANVFIDTTGRNPHDLADQYEISDFLRSRTEIRKCLAIQATIHPLDAFTAIRKFELYGADSLVMTKLDETLRPGAMIELARENALPVAYLCSGQRVPEDLVTATPEKLADMVLN